MPYLALIAQELVIIFCALVLVLIPLIALVDILKSNFKGNDKLIWVIVVIFTNLMGAILYFFIGRKQKVE